MTYSYYGFCGSFFFNIMAKDKKSVLLYCDIIHTVEKLDDKTAGELFKHYLRYVNDLNPTTDNLTVDLVFEPIKQNLKRDLKKWEDTIDKRSEAGQKSAGTKAFKKWLEETDTSKMTKTDHEWEMGVCYKKMNENYGNYMYYYYQLAHAYHSRTLSKLTKSTSVESVQQSSTKSTVKDNVTVIVNDTVNDILLEKETKKIFVFKNEMFNAGFEKKLVQEWLLVRKKKKATNTETALKGFLREINKSHLDKNKVLEICIERSWSGFKNEWLEKEKSTPKKEKVNAGLILQKKYGLQ